MSSLKTDKLGLNKWVPTDYVNMGEFNDNFQKIDDAHKDVTTQLADKVKKNELVLNVKDFDAKGDGITDDTTAINATFTLARSIGANVFFPKGLYKVTAPIVVGELMGNQRGFYAKIYGQGYNMDDLGSRIIGYNIPQGRSVLELVGENNGYGNQFDIEMIQIEQDASCDDNSFCLTMGDAWMFKGTRIKLRGKNCLKTRCGSKPGATKPSSYAMINTEFVQCHFDVLRDYTSGWAVMHEVVESGWGAPYDNIKFQSCWIGGLTQVHAYTTDFDNCIFSVNPNRITKSVSSSFLDVNQINFADALLVTYATSVTFRKCYFEDFSTGILIKPVGSGIIRNVEIKNCYFNGLTNYKDVNSNFIPAKRAVDIQPSASSNPGYVDMVILRGNTIRDVKDSTLTLFTEIPVRNNYAEIFVFEDNVNTGQLRNRYEDTYSKRFSVNDMRLNFAKKSEIVEFNTKAIDQYGATATIKDSTVVNYPVHRKCWIEKIEIIGDSNLVSTNVAIVTRKNGSGLYSVNFMDNSKLDSSTTTGGYYAIISSAISSTNASLIYEKGDLFTVSFDFPDTVNATDYGKTFKIKVHLAY